MDRLINIAAILLALVAPFAAALLPPAFLSFFGWLSLTCVLLLAIRLAWVEWWDRHMRL